MSEPIQATTAALYEKQKLLRSTATSVDPTADKPRSDPFTNYARLESRDVAALVKRVGETLGGVKKDGFTLQLSASSVTKVPEAALPAPPTATPGTPPVETAKRERSTSGKTSAKILDIEVKVSKHSGKSDGNVTPVPIPIPTPIPIPVPVPIPDDEPVIDDEEQDDNDPIDYEEEDDADVTDDVTDNTEDPMPIDEGDVIEEGEVEPPVDEEVPVEDGEIIADETAEPSGETEPPTGDEVIPEATDEPEDDVEVPAEGSAAESTDSGEGNEPVEDDSAGDILPEEVVPEVSVPQEEALDEETAIPTDPESAFQPEETESAEIEPIPDTEPTEAEEEGDPAAPDQTDPIEDGSLYGEGDSLGEQIDLVA